MALKFSAKMMSSIPKCNKIMTCLRRKLLNKLHSDMSYTALGCEINVNESITYTK